jgi:hypothetical protein
VVRNLRTARRRRPAYPTGNCRPSDPFAVDPTAAGASQQGCSRAGEFREL